MEYRGTGFSNIRLPDDNHNYIYKYDTRINTFPEEVLVHEFLHTLERNAEEYGEERPELHSSSQYGYENKGLNGLKQWYQDYMNQEIKTSTETIGLPSMIYTKKPAKTTDFTHSYELDALKEAENIIEEFRILWNKVKKTFTMAEQMIVEK